MSMNAVSARTVAPQRAEATLNRAPLNRAPQAGAPSTPDTRERLRAFGHELDALKQRVFAQVGEPDVAHVKRVRRFSTAMEVVGRVLIHFSVEPVSFALGVGALFLHKQLEATEIGHSALHGAYDKLPGAERFRSRSFYWDTPIDEAGWRNGHNVRHHGNTNVAGRDPDIHFGPVRLTDKTPHAPEHRGQLPLTLGVLFPNFGFLMNLHFSGVLDVHADNGQADKLDFLPDRSWPSVKKAYARALRKFVPYYALNYVLFPLLAGPMFWKVLLGNWLAEVMRDVYSAATIYCGHVGAETASYTADQKAQSRGEWYAMQVEASNDFEVSYPLSLLCGALDRQIEHHLFPTLPPNRLREIAPEVRAICARHGVRYRTGSWPSVLKGALQHIHNLSRAEGTRGVLREMA
jgi:NADPH-dependent stearoyl-CoA 9-desaturase